MKAPFRILVLSHAGAGKTAFIHRLETGSFLEDYTPSEGITATLLEYRLSHGIIKYHLFDCAAENMAMEADAVTHPTYFPQIRVHARQLRTYYPNIPVVLCANKADLEGRMVSVMKSTGTSVNVLYIDISVATGSGMDDVITCLLEIDSVSPTNVECLTC